jgi:hypothetical protein
VLSPGCSCCTRRCGAVGRLVNQQQALLIAACVLVYTEDYDIQTTASQGLCRPKQLGASSGVYESKGAASAAPAA